MMVPIQLHYKYLIKKQKNTKVTGGGEDWTHELPERVLRKGSHQNTTIKIKIKEKNVLPSTFLGKLQVCLGNILYNYYSEPPPSSSPMSDNDIKPSAANHKFGSIS